MRVYCWFFISCLTLHFLVGAAQTSCRVSSVKENERANLTCYFPEDVSQSKKDFTVFHYKVPVLECLWVSSQLKCLTVGGYEFDNVVTNTAVLAIFSVTANETGRYSCQITGIKPEDLGFCELFLSQGKSTCEIRVVKETPPQTDLICHFPEDVRKSRKGFTVYRYDDRGDAATVADCLWYMDNLQCYAHPGIQLYSSVSDRFVVRISRTLADESESYMCRVSGSLLEDASFCLRRAAERENCPQSLSETSVVLLLLGVAVLILVAAALLLLRHKAVRCLQVCFQDQHASKISEDVECCRNRRGIASSAHYCQQPGSVHIKPQPEQVDLLVSSPTEGNGTLQAKTC